ncbi:phosphonate C-P lyase system protein PhnH [Kaistia algarum]|uniref:phosphonate C-P lyase system protein PhnH n=1 Tax=Kaistia algarum TaxID=2083279 RepID=UPI000CE8F315|nr:phosphonate C-P lyase system protein PhnH [Kaistia algarum]MCX5513196.1 phosphonate C-P lyase system protein PhnH [Kaistia algarum]PPE81340.1 phosphonate C-P lyase system protein PhnH [Kaistia algarum]
MSAAIATSGLAEPALDGQANFRSLMNALARPGTIEPLSLRLAAPAPLTAGLAALALSLADHEAPLWLDAALASSNEVVTYLRFHTGARIVADPQLSAFALVADFAAMPPLATFSLGSDDYPDRSTTILAAVQDLGTGVRLELTGPGILGEAHVAVSPWRDGLTGELADNRSLFPCGVDLVLVAADAVAALPRTTHVREV